MRKPLLFWLLTALLLCGIVEAMAWLTYRWLYGESTNGMSAETDQAALEARAVLQNRFQGRALHPFYGLVSGWHNLDLNMPPSSLGSRRLATTWEGQDAVVVGVLGGSVAADVVGSLAGALLKHLAKEGGDTPAWPILIDLAYSGYHHPQQSLVFTNVRASGVQFDIVVSLDGVNEVWLPMGDHKTSGIYPVYPARWSSAVGFSADQRVAVARMAVLREEQRALTTSAFGGSALLDLARRYRLDQIGRLIVDRHQDLAATGQERHNLQSTGPFEVFTKQEVRNVMTETWYRSALFLAGMAERHGAEYYHFLQPNQYIPGSKPLSDDELASAYAPGALLAQEVREGYPKLAEYGAALREQGVKFFDLTHIFADHDETLYIDQCCHLNERGNELLAEHILRRLLDNGRLGGGPRLWPAAKRYKPEPTRYQAVHDRIVNGDFGAPAARSVFNVYREGRTLAYLKRHCTVADIAASFFVNFTRNNGSGVITPRFHFTQHGAMLEGDTCVGTVELPDFGIEHLRTGQFWAKGTAEEWSVELDVSELNILDRATKAAWEDEAAVERYRSARERIKKGELGMPVARSVFDVYRTDGGLVYFKQPCAAGDINDSFFLHITPSLEDQGVASMIFRLAERGAMLDGDTCVAIAELPDYEIGHIRTGQTTGRRDTWSVEPSVWADEGR